jgi:acyl transferase domain-containing protein
MLSPEGRCKTLDASADGYLRAEAVGVLALMPAHNNNTRGDAMSGMLALLVGAAVNQDGRSSALTAPNGPAQQDVMRAALGSGATGLSPADMSMLGMHGTGAGPETCLVACCQAAPSSCICLSGTLVI